jgi:hypothetical protein
LYQPFYLRWLPDFTPGAYPNPYWQEAPEPPVTWQEDMVMAVRQNPVFAPVFQKTRVWGFSYTSSSFSDKFKYIPEIP